MSDLKVENIMQNWRACLLMRNLKKSKKVSWSSPPMRFLKFNVDGAARGKPGPAGIGGVLRNQGGVLYMFLKHVGGSKIPMEQKFWLYRKLFALVAVFFNAPL